MKSGTVRVLRVTCKKCNQGRVHHEKIVTKKKCNRNKCYLKKVNIKIVQLETMIGVY